MNVNDTVKKDLCCGCGACIDICPVKAISFHYDEEDWQNNVIKVVKDFIEFTTGISKVYISFP